MTRLNNNTWTLQLGETATGKGMWSYSKLLDTTTQYSIIDYCIADSDILPFIQKFEVCSTIEKTIDSDHVPLLKNIMIGENKNNLRTSNLFTGSKPTGQHSRQKLTTD